MAKGLYIDARQLVKGAKAMERLTAKFPDIVSDILNDNAEAIVLRAKRDAPADRGDLRKGISFTNDKQLEKHITSRAPYSAYVEFGTGKYAAQEVSKYPPAYQTFAAQYRGGKKPSIKGLLFILMEWFERVGIKDKQHRYFIAKNIFINGIHPHPFLIPALIDQQKEIIKDFQNALKQLKIV